MARGLTIGYCGMTEALALIRFAGCTAPSRKGAPLTWRTRSRVGEKRMPEELRELPPPRMFPRTEGQAKACVVLLVFVLLAALAYALAHGLDLFGA